MEDISNRASDFNDDVRNKVKNYLKILKNPCFLTTLIFLIDGLDRIQIFSKILQEKEGVVVGKENDRKALLASLEALKTNDGIYLASFIDEANCFKDLSWRKYKSKYMDDPNAKITYKDVGCWLVV